MSVAADQLPTPAVLRTANAPVPLAALLSPLHLARTLTTRRAMIAQFALRELTARNKGTLLGLAWTFLHPLLMLAVYTFVFAVVWQARWGDADASANHALFATSVFCGLIVYDVFGSTVAAAPSLIVSQPNYVKKVIFPLEVLPLAQLGASLCVCGVSILILVGGNLLFAGGISPTIWLFPVVLVPLLSLAAGIAWFLAALGVFLRDLKQLVVGVLVPVLFFVTPIFYPPERVPGSFRWIIGVNPLAAIVDNARRTLLYGQWPDWHSLGLSALAGLVALQLGYAFFMKAKRSFADVL
jgi:lipopolysaccharide transport system permease protein